MNCKNCGGAMELVATRGYFFCRYCGSFHFPDSAADGGIKVLGDLGTPSPCVVCRQPLTSATLDDTHDVRYCRNCRGALLRRTSFAAVVEQRRAWALDTPGPPVALNRSELDRKVSMPGLHSGNGDSSLLRAGKCRDRQLCFVRAGLARFRRSSSRSSRRRARIEEHAGFLERSKATAWPVVSGPDVSSRAIPTRMTSSRFWTGSSSGCSAPITWSYARRSPPNFPVLAFCRGCPVGWRARRSADGAGVPGVEGLPATGARRRGAPGLQRVPRSRVANPAARPQERSGQYDDAGTGAEPERPARRRARDAAAPGVDGYRDRRGNQQ